MEKDLSHSRWYKEPFLACFQQHLCPLCRVIWQLDAQRFDWYINDGALDEETLHLAVEAASVCPPHAMALALLEGKTVRWSHLGSSLLHLEILQKVWLPTLQRAFARPARPTWGPWSRWLSPSWHQSLSPHTCLLCAEHQQHEDRAVNAFVQLYTNDQAFRQAFQAADSPCLSHLQQVHSALTLPLAERRLLPEGFTGTYPADEQVRTLSNLLFGAEELLWFDVWRRGMEGSHAFPSIPCQICQQSQQQEAASFSRFIDFLASYTQPFSFCKHHRWWWHSQCQAHPRLAARVVDLLLSLVREYADPLLPRAEQEQTCLLCRWKQTQEMPLLLQALHAAQDGAPVSPLCIWHGRSLLWEHSDQDGAVAFVAQGLLSTLAPLLLHLQGHVLHCDERLPFPLQPEEQLAWLEVIQWFGGGEVLTSLQSSSLSQSYSTREKQEE